MAPNTYAPASLGFAIVFLTVAILPCFALLGFAIYKVRSWMASRRPVDVEAAISQIQPKVVPVVGHPAFDAQQMNLKDNLQDSRDAVTTKPSTGTEPIQAARPESLLVEEPVKEPVLEVEVENISAPGPAPSSSFELWANKLFTMKDEFADEGCSLSSSYSLTSTIDTDSSSTATTEEHEPESEEEDIDDVLSNNTESTYIGLVSLPSFMDLPAILDEDDVAAPMIMVTPPTPKIEWEEDNDNDAFESLLVASPSFTALATAFDDEEGFEEEDDGLDEAMQAMITLTTYELEPIAEEPERRGRDRRTYSIYYSGTFCPRVAQLPDRARHSGIVIKKIRLPSTVTHRRPFLFGPVSSTPKAIPIIKFTPPTPPRRVLDGEDESSESEYELDERVAFDIVVYDDGSFFF
ncbi:hypothetical protein VNI00_015175 [Paramarasmius palmivorus]|uniref:Uncharacterized protein n=1 Tax=Paramarasmius palmivorus TaxID=297713 RepID=A0AAW0BLP4_9AGAR